MYRADELLSYVWLARDEGFDALELEIVYKDLCSGCGVCSAVCPENVISVEEFPKLTGECTNCGYCLQACPRSFIDRKAYEEKLFGSISDDILGSYILIKAARSKNEKVLSRAQDGGFVTEMLGYMLKNGIIDGAIVASVDDNKKPLPTIARSLEDIYKSGGTKYANSPNLALLKEAKEKNLRVALVGLPCQIEGFRKLENYKIEDIDLTSNVVITIAIFCKSNFLLSLYDYIEEKYGVKLKEMKKVDIKGKNFIIKKESGDVLKIPLKEAYKYRRAGCKVCLDFSSRLSDVSVGSVGSPSGYSTVIVRSEKAKEIFESMEKDGVIETKEVDDEGLEKIRKLAQLKVKDSKKIIKRRIKEALPLPYRSLLEWVI